MALDRKSKIKDIVENAQALAVVEKYLPGFSGNPGIKAAYGMTLQALIKFPQTKCPPETQEKLLAELEGLNL
jgi:hypothetical protein